MEMETGFLDATSTSSDKKDKNIRNKNNADMSARLVGPQFCRTAILLSYLTYIKHIRETDESL